MSTERLISSDSPRFRMIALSLGGRWSAYHQAWWLSPARADKALRLERAGFIACRTARGWRYVGPNGGRHLLLSEALKFPLDGKQAEASPLNQQPQAIIP